MWVLIVGEEGRGELDFVTEYGANENGTGAEAFRTDGSCDKPNVFPDGRASMGYDRERWISDRKSGAGSVGEVRDN